MQGRGWDWILGCCTGAFITLRSESRLRVMDGAGRTAEDRLRSNEKLKVGASVVANLGTGLFAAAFGRWFLSGLDGWAIVWIVFGGTGIAMAVQAMSFLQPEND